MHDIKAALNRTAKWCCTSVKAEDRQAYKILCYSKSVRMLSGSSEEKQLALLSKNHIGKGSYLFLFIYLYMKPTHKTT